MWWNAKVTFRALPEFDLRGADVAFVSQGRWDSTPGDDNLHGSPELVMEVLSPSNSKREMSEKAALYLSTGAQEFWIVDAVRQMVTVMEVQGTVTYRVGDKIPLRLLGGELGVSEIFG